MPIPPHEQSDDIHHGIYDALLDEALRDALSRHPELRAVLTKIDSEEQPARYSAFIGKIIEKALGQETDPIERLRLCNRLVELISASSATEFLAKHKLISDEKSILSEITPPNYLTHGIPRPHTSITKAASLPALPRNLNLHTNCKRNVLRRWSGHPGLIHQMVRPAPPDAGF